MADAIERVEKKVSESLVIMYSKTRNNKYYWLARPRKTKRGTTVYDRIYIREFLHTLDQAIEAAEAMNA
jgi:hypothetical protein